MYLVDTNVLSEARRRSPEALAWLSSVEPSSIFLSVVTLGEIMRGIALKSRTDPRAASSLTLWLKGLQDVYASQILPVTDRIAIEWGKLAALRPRGMADALIIATAVVHDKAIVTRNIADFDDTKLPIISPWRS